jgi:serine/threonine protein kinase
LPTKLFHYWPVIVIIKKLARVPPFLNPQKNMLTVNQVLQQGRYLIIDEFAQNGINGGYKAYDTVLETNVVLKENRVDLDQVTTFAQMETLKSAFANEAKILTELKHESLAQVHNYFAEVNRQYLVAEHIDGEFLSELFEKNTRPFSVEKAALIADRLLDALTYLHTRVPPIVHRGIKPQDIKLTSDGKVKLLIFGITADSEAKPKIDFTNPTFDTANLYYLPLEQIWEGLDTASRKVIANSYDERSQQILETPADARSDIYSLAATLYHLLTGRRPIDALERSIEILEGKTDPLPAPSQINPEVPTEISAVLMKAMEIRRENRFSSAAVMRQVLQSAVSQTKVREAAPSIDSDEDDVLEIEFAVQPPAPKHFVAETENSEGETEKTKQIELMKERLRNAEEQRLLAEQRAVEAEKRLLEKEAAQITEVELAAEDVNSADVLPETSISATALPGKDENLPEASLDETKPEEFEDLFAEPRKESKFLRRMAAVVAILVALGGAGWGAWMFLQSNQPAQDPAVFTSEEKNSPMQATKPIVEPTPEVSPLPEASASPESVETLANSPAAKSKAALQSAQSPAKKPAIAAKTPAPKKPVTVDDLINDN